MAEVKTKRSSGAHRVSDSPFDIWDLKTNHWNLKRLCLGPQRFSETQEEILAGVMNPLSVINLTFLGTFLPKVGDLAFFGLNNRLKGIVF